MSNLETYPKDIKDAESKAQQIKKEAKEKNEHLLHSQTKEAEDQKRGCWNGRKGSGLNEGEVISNAELRVRDEKLKASSR